MPEIPEEAVQAAAEVLERREFGDKTFAGYARAALTAAAPLIAEQARREVAEEIRKLAQWEFSGGFANLFAFQARHERLAHVETTQLSMAFRALADEIEGDARGSR